MDDQVFVSFLCKDCKSEIRATVDMIGSHTECPACGASLVVPDASSEGVERHGPDDECAAMQQAMKSRTIRIELSDEL